MLLGGETSRSRAVNVALIHITIMIVQRKYRRDKYHAFLHVFSNVDAAIGVKEEGIVRVGHNNGLRQAGGALSNLRGHEEGNADADADADQ
ncbi:hypothetical protein CGCF415_v004236 [Colletotrichum fructicola]|uniref:Uncharacterized protein n=1 Tax=Colletotrichum fructicola (strain Nara gc5) TaxID=1213859 RepID=A0A7J6JQ44_COLFN|nr:hypothetical protein CFRS1_v013536 [Colletotrichum fructicola]KAF4492123.1 hypothetical protein CGGC5_v001955 [Colletotrichum fructicola Nara gc5]KAF4897419.1 hypothetical protein CGCFRS4_v004974 [Colletotrichum fructicola]KAF4911800.1 hypothetical protein CGCF415_v004236 [Colletotrichum fructicola]KAF4941840.1 hypothetical protein CGCF245_v001133 [Colletotrichum fructicola]